MVYFISRVLFGALLYTAFRFEVVGRENVPKRGPFIVVSNHVSYGDPVVMGVAIGSAPVIFVAKKELFDIPVFKYWFKGVGCIPIDRNSSGKAQPMKDALKRLREGKVVGAFPEGTRSQDGQLKKFEPGIGLLAVKSGVPIIPMYISGTKKALPTGRGFPRPCKVRANIGKAVDIAEYMKLSDKRKIYESITEKIRDAISRLKDE